MRLNYERKTPDLGRVRGSFRWVLWGSKCNGTSKQGSASECIRPPPAWGPRSVTIRSGATEWYFISTVVFDGSKGPRATVVDTAFLG